MRNMLFNYLILVCGLFISSLGFSQYNLDSIGRIDYASLHGGELNDVWGYVDTLGNEYALVGSTIGTSVVDLSNPSNPTEVFWKPGATSVWRDLKTYDKYAYVTTEGGDGLLIIDLSPLPGSIVNTTNYYGGVDSVWATAHNLYVDENGYAYIFGANRGNGGVIILDVATDPLNPQEVGVFDDWYVHDGYVKNDTMYLGHISDGFISIVDVTDKSNPILLGTKETPSTFSHNIWTTDDQQYAFTTDEVSAGYIGAFDISDPSNIIEIDRIQSSPGEGVIPHNTHVLNNHIVTSYYADGVVIHDVTHPYNMVEVGRYDTYPDQTTSYDGCWGVYPFLPSGLVLATDIEFGLFVLEPTYVQAAYLEGVITDANSLLPIQDVNIQILADDQVDVSNTNGFYATGIVDGGTYDVLYSKIGYYPQTISVTIGSGAITIQDVELVPIPPYNLTVNVYEIGTSNPIDGADIKLVADQMTHQGVSNAMGQESFVLYYQEEYEVYVGKWEWITSCENIELNDATGSIDVYLDKGFYDDFIFDNNWTISGSPETGQWERGVPFNSGQNAAPNFDVDTDCGEMAYVTGNAETYNVDVDDVDAGVAILRSPIMDLSAYTDPYISYYRWFYNEHGPLPPPDDTLKLYASNGLETVIIDKVGKDPSIFGLWVEKNIRLADFLTVTNSMQFRFQTSDLDPGINITEAAIDKFYIVEANEIGIDEVENEIGIYPNPFLDEIFISGLTDEESYNIYSVAGSMVVGGQLKLNGVIDVSGLPSGAYFIELRGHTYKIFKQR